MQIVKSTLRLAVLPLALLNAFSAIGQTANGSEVLVSTVTLDSIRRQDALSDVTVIDRTIIKASTARTLAELLARQAGLQFVARGGRGKTIDVFIRGTEGRQVILLIDGVRYGPASTPGFDSYHSAIPDIPQWENMPLEMIERIEVVKGPMSALYGSGGVGGVVQIFTRRGQEGLQPYASVAAGSAGHKEVSAGFTGGAGNWTYAMGVQRLKERGFSATNRLTPSGDYNPDDDGLEQSALNASAALRINKDWQIDAHLFHAEGINEIDDGARAQARMAARGLVVGIGIKGTVRPGWHTELRAGESVDTAHMLTSAQILPIDHKTNHRQLTWQNTVDTPVGVALAGVEISQHVVDSSKNYNATRRTFNAVFLGLHGSHDAHNWQFNVRRDNNSQMGGVSSAFAGYGFRVTPNLRLNVSRGTSFVAPLFDDLYGSFYSGRYAAFEPERSRNTDVGLTWATDGHEVKLVRFDNTITGYKVNNGLATFYPVGNGRHRVKGWTLGYQGKVGPVTLRTSVEEISYAEGFDTPSGGTLPRYRARQQATLGADYVTGAWKFGGALLRVGPRLHGYGTNLVLLEPHLPSYTTLDLYARYAFHKNWSAQISLNNVTNKQYGTVLGHNEPGAGAYFTLRWQPK